MQAAVVVVVVVMVVMVVAYEGLFAGGGVGCMRWLWLHVVTLVACELWCWLKTAKPKDDTAAAAAAAANGTR